MNKRLIILLLENQRSIMTALMENAMSRVAMNEIQRSIIECNRAIADLIEEAEESE